MAFPIALALAGAQMAIGALTKGKEQIPDPLKPRISEGTATSTARMRGLANASVEPGREESETRIRQHTADSVGKAKMMFKDPSKILSVLNQSNVRGLRAGQELDRRGKEFRASATAGLANAEARQGIEEQNVRREKERQFQQVNTAKRNLFGAGIENILEHNKENKMLDFYKKLYGDDIDFGDDNKGEGGVMGFLKQIFGGRDSLLGKKDKPTGFGSGAGEAMDNYSLTGSPLG